MGGHVHFGYGEIITLTVLFIILKFIKSIDLSRFNLNSKTEEILPSITKSTDTLIKQKKKTKTRETLETEITNALENFSI